MSDLSALATEAYNPNLHGLSTLASPTSAQMTLNIVSGLQLPLSHKMVLADRLNAPLLSTGHLASSKMCAPVVAVMASLDNSGEITRMVEGSSLYETAKKWVEKFSLPAAKEQHLSALVDWLTKNKIKLDAFDTNGRKSIDSLLKDLQKGSVVLATVREKPIIFQRVSILTLLCRDPRGRQVELYEDHQVRYNSQGFATKLKRGGLDGIAEKADAGESLCAAVFRGLREEIDLKKLYSFLPVPARVRIRNSRDYPIKEWNFFKPWVAEAYRHDYKPEYREVQHNTKTGQLVKETVFKWRECRALTNSADILEKELKRVKNKILNLLLKKGIRSVYRSFARKQRRIGDQDMIAAYSGPRALTELKTPLLSSDYSARAA